MRCVTNRNTSHFFTLNQQFSHASHLLILHKFHKPVQSFCLFCIIIRNFATLDYYNYIITNKLEINNYKKHNSYETKIT